MMLLLAPLPAATTADGERATQADIEENRGFWRVVVHSRFVQLLA